MKNHSLVVAALSVVNLVFSARAQINVATPAFAIGSFGSGDGQLDGPRGVGVTLDSVYVGDANNYRIQQFTANGEFVSSFGSQGLADGQLNFPLDLCLDSNDNVIVLDSYNNRVQKFSPDGVFQMKFGRSGTGLGQFNTPRCIAIDSFSNLYVADGFNNRVQKFSADGTYLATIGGYGSANGRFIVPVGIVLDAQNNLYVADQGNYRIQKFNSSGQFITKWGSRGSGPGQFQISAGADGGPNDMAIDAAGNVVVADAGNSRIQVFTSMGKFIAQFGSAGTALGQFNLPGRLAFNPTRDRLYVAEISNNRIQVFNYTVPPPSILSIARSGSSATITWSAIPGRVYQIEAKNDLNESTWSPLGDGQIPDAYPASAQVPTDDKMKIIRVRLVPVKPNTG
jgi:tripartite motif-containing protein 71